LRKCIDCTCFYNICVARLQPVALIPLPHHFRPMRIHNGSHFPSTIWVASATSPTMKLCTNQLYPEVIHSTQILYECG
jgi:hypothetical protein